MPKPESAPPNTPEVPACGDAAETCAIISPVEKLPDRTKTGLLMLRRMLKGTVQYSGRVLELDKTGVERAALRSLNELMGTWLREMEEFLREQGVKV